MLTSSEIVLLGTFYCCNYNHYQFAEWIGICVGEYKLYIHSVIVVLFIVNNSVL